MNETKNEIIILNIIKYGAILPIIFLSLFITYLLINEKNKELEKEIEKIKKEYLEVNKEKVKNQVEDTYKSIIYEIQTSEKDLKNQLKSKVYEAHNIATNIYEEESGHNNLGHAHSNKHILNTIKFALSGMIYNKNRGYVFILDEKGKLILQPLNKELEGKNFYNHQDLKGSFFVRNIVNTITNKTETFDTYFWPKNEDDDTPYKKISFYKYFEPLNLAICTGEYVEDYNNELKEKIINAQRNRKFNKNNYIFIFDEVGKYLVHYNDKKIDTNGFTIKDSKGKYFIKDMYDYSKENKEGFVSYIATGNPTGQLRNNEKISYVKYVEEWGWMIGSGFYLEELNKILEKKETELILNNQNIIEKILFFSSVITVALLILSFFASKLIQSRFRKYKDDIRQEIRNRIKNEKILYNQSKMASMGEMLLNIAHQWRQPLSVISTSATGAKVQKQLNCFDDNDFINVMDNINNSAQYLSQTIEDFRNFLLPSGEKEIFDVKTTINKTIKLIQANLESDNIKIVSNLEDISINSYENELIQVLINFIKNAKDILVERDIENKLIFINLYSSEEKIFIEVKDNANGIDEKIIDNIFEPYFTTKHKSVGTGIGLYMSLELIRKKLDGDIKVVNEDYEYENISYKGAKFKIILNK